MRTAADLGVAGWVLQHGQAVLVDDPASEPRFYRGIDEVTGMTTRAILCAPLRTRAGNIGVLEVINPRDHFAGEDVAFLDALAADIAISCERARLYDQLRRETVSLRKVCRNAGLGLAALGVVFVTGALYAHLARALPLAEEDSRRRR